MAQPVLSVVGYYVGNMIAPGIGGYVGSMIGSYIGGVIDPTELYGARLDDLKLPRVDYGSPIQRLWGRARMPGIPIWQSAIREIAATDDGKGGGTEVTTYSYECDVLYLVADNEIAAVSRVWRNSELVYSALHGSSSASLGASLVTTAWEEMVVYTGDAAQLPDPTYEAAVGVGNVPAYRGRGTVMLKGVQLGQGKQLPLFAFEVLTEASSSTQWVETSTRPAHDLYLVSVMNALYPPPDNIEYTISGPSFQVGDGVRSAAAPNWEVRSDTAVTASGKRYFEWAVDMTGHSAAMETWVDIRGACDEVGASATGYYTLAGTIMAAPVEGFGRFPFGSTGSVPRILMLAVDFEAELYWVGMDGAWGTHPAPGAGMNTGNPATGVGGRPFNVNVPGGDVWIHFEIGYASTPKCSASLRTAAAMFSYVPPAGFVPWSSDTAEAQVWTPGAVYLDDVVIDLCALSGLDASQVDVAALSAIEVTGVPLTAVAPARATLETLGAAHYFECVESDRLYFRARGGAVVATITADELAAGENVPAEGDAVGLERGNDLEVPARWSVRYINVDDDYQAGSVYSDRMIGESDEVRAITVPLVLTPSRAQGLVDTLALDARVAATRVKASAADTRPQLEPTDVLTLVDEHAISYRARIVQETFAAGVLQWELVLDDAGVLGTSGTTQGYTPGISVQPIDVSEAQYLDIPILRDEDDSAGVYAVVTDLGGRWPGATYMLSRDGTNYTQAGTAIARAPAGRTTTALGGWSGGNVFDEAGSVTVDVGAATLASYSREAILAGAADGYLIGDELIYARTATFVSAGVYTLSGLLRGRRGTEWAIGTHAVGDRVVLLQASSLRRLSLQLSDRGATLQAKAVSAGRSVASASALGVTPQLVGLMPLSPVDLRIARDGSNNATITWSRRSRLSCRFLAAGVPVPLGEAVEAYEVDIVSGGTVVRTISAATESASYSAAQQTADGLTPGAAITVRIHQLSAAVGRGFALEGTA